MENPEKGKLYYYNNRPALRNIGIDFEVVGISEIDKYALKAYELIYGHCPNYGDICKIDWKAVPDFDLFTYSFPCQDISLAGKTKGLSKNSGTRSSLLWECAKVIEIKKPKYLLMENVKNLVSKKFIGDFLEWQNYLSNLGYTNFSQILNAKDYGVPQNRERVFMISILGDAWYNFPQKQRLTKCLRDVLEDNVDEKYYLSEKMLEGFKIHANRHNEAGNGFGFTPNDVNRPARCVNTREGCVATSNWIKIAGNLDIAREDASRVYDTNGLCPTINTMQGGCQEPKILQRSHGYNNGSEFDICPTITTSSFEHNNYVVTDRIRRITPKEAMRLMGVSDSDFEKLNVISDSQKYKLAGNSICVPVLEGIFRELFSKE